jgi:integrase
MRLAAPAAKTERARRIVTIPEFGSGQEGFRFVNLRHTGATLALEAGANPILVALRLGHTSTRMVEQHYAGRLDGADKEIAGVRTRVSTFRVFSGPISLPAAMAESGS